jgi:hypothetical protein
MPTPLELGLFAAGAALALAAQGVIWAERRRAGRPRPGPPGPSFRCPECGRISVDPADVAGRSCGHRRRSFPV